MEQLADLKKDILIDNALDWKKFKLLVAIICNYVVRPLNYTIELRLSAILSFKKMCLKHVCSLGGFARCRV